jgi:phage shock protein C
MESSTVVRPQLTRVSTGQAIAGVCAGLARYFAIDPALVRLVFVVFALAGGASVLAYIVLWIIMPISSDGDAAVAVGRQASSDFVAITLIAAGALWLFANLGVFTWVQWRYAWPVALVVLGFALLVRRTRS